MKERQRAVWDCSHDEFAALCTAAFRPLVEQFGFEEPRLEKVGRESLVRYRKGPRTVSITYELGSRPVLEIFQPTRERAGITLRAAPGARGGLGSRRPRSSGAEGAMAAYLARSAQRLIEVEREIVDRNA